MAPLSSSAENVLPVIVSAKKGACDGVSIPTLHAIRAKKPLVSGTAGEGRVIDSARRSASGNCALQQCAGLCTPGQCSPFDCTCSRRRCVQAKLLAGSGFCCTARALVQFPLPGRFGGPRFVLGRAGRLCAHAWYTSTSRGRGQKAPMHLTPFLQQGLPLRRFAGKGRAVRCHHARCTGVQGTTTLAVADDRHVR